MKVIIARDLKNYFKNPLYWIGILIIIGSIYTSLSTYTKIHLYTDEKELKGLPEIATTDADIMNGYIPTSENERIQIGLEEIRKIFVKSFNMTEKESEAAIKDIEAQNLAVQDMPRYIQKKYGFYDAKAIFLEAKWKKAQSINEANTYISKKLKEHSYSFYFSRKFADFASFHIAVFSGILLLFLFKSELKKDIYELIHTKPISAEKYVLGKFLGGFFALLFAIFSTTIIFSIICQFSPLQRGVIDNTSHMFCAMLLYIVPTIVIITGIYILITLLFRNSFPAIPLIFAYIVYSNMGGYDYAGNYGFQGKILGILFRFDGGFFETKIQPIFLLNQGAIILLTIISLIIAVQIWKKKRV